MDKDYKTMDADFERGLIEAAQQASAGHQRRARGQPGHPAHHAAREDEAPGPAAAERNPAVVSAGRPGGRLTSLHEGAGAWRTSLRWPRRSACCCEMNDMPCLSVASPAAALGARRGGRGPRHPGHELHAREPPPGREGVALFRRHRARDPDLPVLVMTAWTSLETAVQMVKEGRQRLPGQALGRREAAGDGAQPAAHARAAPSRRRAADRGCASSWRAHDLRGRGLREPGHAPRGLAGRAGGGGRRAGADHRARTGSGKEKIAEIVQANSRAATSRS